MQVPLQEALNGLLDKLGSELDIPDHIYEDAVIKYERVGEWLDAEDSPLRQYMPRIFPQGSFRLGTVVRPIEDEGEYDIDLVCRLIIDKEDVTQQELKEKVGERLQAHDEFKVILEESRRCWRLDYPQQFHMDVLPTIPNIEHPPTGILLTDTDLHLWQKSNPEAYANWFYQRMQVMAVRQKEMLFKADESYKSMEEVPDWRIRTPLQRAVQILKRHRDIYFAGNYEHYPVSIILTTLAAKAYNNQNTIFDAIIEMVKDMPRYIEFRNDKWWVENPVEPGENFADKWNEKPERREAFLHWLIRVRLDFESALKTYSIQEAKDLLGRILGTNDLNRAAKAVGLVTTAKPVSKNKAVPLVPQLGNTQHVHRLVEPERRIYKAKIVGSVHLSSGKKLWPLSKSPVPKNVRIRFAVSTTTPKPYLVKWQVVNTGAEAEAAHQPRGDFYESDPSSANVRWEYTGYLGTHWIEAFIIKNGESVARSGRTLVRVR